MNQVQAKIARAGSQTSVKKARKLVWPSLYKEEKVTMIVRFARWLLNKFDNQNDLISSISTSERILDRHNNTVTFSVHPASGGYVIESSYYNEREDRHMRGLHIITNEEDFAKELGSAVFMDLLKNR